MWEMLLRESVIAEQLGILAEANLIVMGISSLRPESIIHISGFLDAGMQQAHYQAAVGSLVGGFLSAQGEPVIGPMLDRIIRLDLDQLRRIPKHIAVAGEMDEVGSNRTGAAVSPPFLTGCSRKTYAAIFSWWAGLMPPMPRCPALICLQTMRGMFGRSLL